MEKRIEQFQEILEKDLKEKLDRVVTAGTVNPEDLQVIDKATDVMLDLIKYQEWLMGGDSNGYSTRRGRNAVTGRYMSYGPSYMRNYNGGSYDDPYNSRYPSRTYGYSGHAPMMEELERMRDEAQTDHERKMVDEWIHMANMGR